MGKESEEFLETGLTHYPAALLAVRRFEETIREQLSLVLSGHAVAPPKITYATGKGPRLYLEASQRVRLNAKVEATVTTGVSWEEAPPYFYVYCADGPSWATHPVDQRFTVDGGISYFCEPEGPARWSVAKRIERLFDEWLRAVTQEGAGRKR